MDEALMASQLYKKGLSVKEIKETVEKKFAQ
jgi:hypothetical protein